MEKIAGQIDSNRDSARPPVLISSQLKLITFIIFITIVTACSFKTIYNRLDYLIPSYVEGMVSLDEMLEEKVEQRTQVLINWHRNTQLIQYADLLRVYQQEFGLQLTEERVLQHMSTMELLWLPLEVKLNEEMAILLPLLNDDQLEELFDSIDDNNEDFYDEYVDLDDEELIEEYIDSLLDNYESWLGELTELQERDVEKAAYKFHSSAALRLQHRKNWQHGLREILDSSDDTDIKSERLRAFFKEFNAVPNVELAAADEANKQAVAWITVKLVHAANAEKKEYFMNKTDDYIRIFTELAENR